jgi:hypothetical protein
MKSLPFANGNNFPESCTREEAEAFENGLRLLAKLIAKAIRRSREEQAANATSK